MSWNVNTLWYCWVQFPLSRLFLIIVGLIRAAQIISASAMYRFVWFWLLPAAVLICPGGSWPNDQMLCEYAFFFIVLGDGFSPSVSNGLVLKRKKGLISKSQVLFALWLFTMMDHTGKQICVFYWLTCSHCNAASNLLTELSSLSCNVN